MRVMAIANQKGGCGKTTTSINLASALALQGRKVLLIDLDPQAHASLGLNIESQNSIYNVISKLTPRKLNIQDIIIRVEKSFDLVPSNILVGTLEQELADEIGRELKLHNILLTFKGAYDDILIDCPPSLGFLTVNALRACSWVIIPAEASKFSIQGANRLMDIVNLIKERLNHPVTCKILVTMFDSRLRHSFSMLAKIKENFSDKVLDTVIHINVKLKESVMMGETLARYDKYSRGFKDYFSLAKELVSLWGENIPTFSSRLSAISQGTTRETTRPGFTQLESRREIQTTFLLEATEAQSVYITGSFNDWSLDESYRLKNENGRWSISLPLKQGVHRYRFIIDGKWQEDPRNPQQEKNPFGDPNSLVEVK